MLCDICNENTATVLCTEIINGKKKERHLCAKCAEKKSGVIMSYRGAVVSDIMSGLLRSSAMKEDSDARTTITCPGCGMTVSEFLHKGKFGCSRCADSFSHITDEYLKKIQGAFRHIGKTESDMPAANEIEVLQAKLNKAVDDEEYEEAARLRDEIKALRKKEK